jgi:choline dehydrogenase-like flavoprotein
MAAKTLPWFLPDWVNDRSRSTGGEVVVDLAKNPFDVIVVGSGAAGGWAAKRLSEAGLKVVLVEAGGPQSDKNFTEHMADFQLKYRDAKDGEPNTAYSRTVAPLPFRSMPNYPYAPETYPDDPEQRTYLREYQTRPGHVLIPPLAPAGR